MSPAEDLNQVVDTRAGLLHALGELALRSSMLDVNHGHESNAGGSPSRELSAILEGTIDVMSKLERQALPEMLGDDEYRELEENTWVGARVHKPTTPRLADICFAATLELSRALGKLVRADDESQRLVAAETARRKLHRALYAALVNGADPAGTGHVATTLLRRRFAVELEAALTVRRLFANFRRALRRAEDKSSDAVLMALRYAAGALATLTTSAHHGTIRLPDRLLLSQQRNRLLDWSRAGRPVSAGLQLLEDIWTCADLLRDINRRQELRTHDEQLIRALLHPASHADADWLTRLERLTGLDDELDAVIGRASAAHGADVMMDALLRLSCLV